MFFLGVILPKIVAHVAHAGRWGASCGALTLRGGKNMQRRGAAGLLLLGLLLGTCLAGSRAQWVCMGGHLPGGGRDRGVQGSPNKTPLTSPDALFYLHHLRSCAMCPVGAVATGGIGTTGGGGGVDLSSFCVGLSHLVCLLCCRVWAIAGDGLAPAGVLLDFQHFLIPFPGRSLGSRLLGYQRPLPPHPLSALVWGPDVAVAAWLAFLHGETPLPVLGPAQPPLPATGGHAGRLGASPGPSPPSGRCGGRVAGGLW